MRTGGAIKIAACNPFSDNCAVGFQNIGRFLTQK